MEGPAWGRRNNLSLYGQSTRVTSSCFQADAAMGKARMRLSHRGLRLHAKVIPAAFPSGKTGHIFGAMDVNLARQREPGMDSDKRRTQAPGVEAGITGT